MTTLSDASGLSAVDVSYAYGAAEVVHGVSFGLAPGEMVALAGPNGSGKTTVLKMLSGSYRAAHGLVCLDGAPLGQISPRHVARRVAVVSQHIDPRLMFTVEAMVTMGRTPYASLWRPLDERDRSAIAGALHAADLVELAERRFGELSGGEQQRVMLAMALAQEADYLLLDEPTVHLDLHHQQELLELLGRLNTQRRIGILAVMHDLNLAALYFSRLAIMQEGRLIADGPPSHILRLLHCLAVFQAPLEVVTHPKDQVPQVLLSKKL